MTITLLILAGAVLAISAAYVVATARGAETALAGETTVVGLCDPTAETIASADDPNAPNTRTDWQLTPVGDLTVAEDLLDSLEARGFAERELVVLGNSSFAVRWR